MAKTKVKEKYLAYILTVVIPIVIILLSFKVNAFNLDFYNKEFVKYGIYEKFSEEEVKQNVNELVNYLQGKDTLTTDFFNEKEKMHLNDVKNLITYASLIFYISLIIFILLTVYFIYTKKFKIAASSFIYGGVFTFVLFLILILAIKLDFNLVFTKFHLMFFTNDLWMLDPATDNLIVLFPQGFFIDMAKRIFIYAIALAVIFILSGISTKFMLKKKKAHTL
jgi:integral membrane protein (TIGR01906 family)